MTGHIAMNICSPAFPLVVAAVLAAAVPALANDFTPVRDETTFMSLVEGRELRLGRFGVSLTLSPDGQIKGRALGWDLTGNWDWQDGYFCRDMDWSGYKIPFNCQLVEVSDNQVVRFTVDRGAGDSASFKLR
jgi:hypothetical protein